MAIFSYTAFRQDRTGIIRSRSVSFSLAMMLALGAPLFTQDAWAIDADTLVIGDTVFDQYGNPKAGNTNNLSIKTNETQNVFQDMHIGRGSVGNGNAVIDGANASLNIGNGLWIGEEGGVGILTISGTAVLDVTGGSTYLGSGGGDGTLKVTGAGTIWTNTNAIVVGTDASSKGTLQIEDSAVVTGASGRVGASSSVVLQNRGVWNSGSLSSAGKVEVLSGSVINSTNVSLFSGATAVVSGAAASNAAIVSQWNVDGKLSVASDGNSSLTISNGAKVTSGTANVGFYNLDNSAPTTIGGQARVVVTGKGTEWNITQDTASQNNLTVGTGNSSANGFNTYGWTGHLEISDGAVVNAGRGSIYGSFTIENAGAADERRAGYYSDVVVTGSESALTFSNGFSIGWYGALSIRDGAKVSTVNDGIYFGPASAEGIPIALISGTGSELRSGTGIENDQGVITVADGGLVSVQTRITLESDIAILNIGAAAGEAAAASGKVEAPRIDGVGGRIVFNHTDSNYEFAPLVAGTANMDIYSGTTTLTGANTFAGETTVYGGILRAGGEQTFSAASDFSVRDGATLDVAGFNQQIGALDNAGTVWLNQSLSQSNGLSRSVSQPGTVLTVGDYVSNGGTIVFNTVLGDSASLTDRLVIEGAITNNATTNVTVVNAGGLGAATTGDGILLIQTSGQGDSAIGVFQLSGRVAAGAYEYSLLPGAGSNATNLYLTSALVDTGTIDNGGGTGTGTITTNGGNKTVGGNSGNNVAYTGSAVRSFAMPTIQNYRVEVPLASAIAPIATEYGYAMLDTLHERVGDMPVIRSQSVYQDRYVKDASGNRAVARSAASYDNREPQLFAGGWARLIGDRGIRDVGSFEKRGPSYDYTFGGIQAGLDIFGQEQAGTVDKAGVYVGYGNISGNVKAANGGKAGDINSDAYTIGAYWTHKDNGGWYTDAVLQGTWYATDAKSVKGQKLKPDGFGFIASLEGGYTYDMGNGLALEPQAQLAYQNTSFGSFNDAYGQFNIADTDSLRGRLGLRLNKTWASGEVSNSMPFSTWVRVNLWHEFMGDSKTTVSNVYGYNPVAISSSLTGTWGEIGVGASGQISESVSVFGTGSYNHSLDNKGREAWDGRLGVNVKW
ncbi:autotransporter outer membrane beta-barrel domain-containing protein [Microvirga sp. W0021]|uniref:Autotransporter outer membrane beta-barrel domain-containing protein n=1 Tax=Hohaiivirga grylli TaxID=3133970 RepID=A0ABV0BP01_9HYPH